MSSMSTTGPASPPVTTTTSQATTAPIDPRHMQSTVALPTLSPPPQHISTHAKTAKKRSSQHLRTDRLGSRSPNSIPSSPTSVHSSSSAIFERDIEPLTPPSPHSTNPHRIPRAKGTETLEHAIPSVLDSAASILANVDNEEGVAVVSPVVCERDYREREGRDFREMAPMGFDVFGRDAHGSGFTSPIGSLGSRSPSPRRTEGLLEALEGVSAHIVSSASSGPGSPRSVKSSISAAAPPSSFATDSPAAPAQHTLQNRLSFISYADLLSSTPASLQPLSSLTTSASTSAEPPHLPAVSATLSPSLSPSLSPHSSSSPNASSSPQAPTLGLGPAALTASCTGSRAPSVRASLRSGGNDSILLVSDDVGGEWEREGLGRGLEERLEGVLVGKV